MEKEREGGGEREGGDTRIDTDNDRLLLRSQIHISTHKDTKYTYRADISTIQFV